MRGPRALGAEEAGMLGTGTQEGAPRRRSKAGT